MFYDKVCLGGPHG